jgi:hypothetical protein
MNTNQQALFHAFETRAAARWFREAAGEIADGDIIVDSLGWQLGRQLHKDSTVYLWPSANDETSLKWISDIAATSKASLKLPAVPTRGRQSDWLRYGADAEAIAKAVSNASIVQNTNEKTDYDTLIALTQKAYVMPEAELQRELRAGQIKSFENSTKYDESDEVIGRLAYYARGEPLRYEHLRESQALRLGVRTGVLDKMVAASQDAQTSAKQETLVPTNNDTRNQGGNLQGGAVLCPEVKPWPTAVDGTMILHEVTEVLGRYVALPEGAADAIALWCAHTHCFRLFRHSARLNICSPEKGCGKSTLRDMIALFVNRPLLLDSLTTAVTFRLLDKHAPTLLADEADAWLRDNEELRGALNAGHSSTGLFARCEGDGNEVRAFQVFAPAALCGIGHLPATLHDRSIVIRLARAKPGEVIARLDSRRTKGYQELARKIARFCFDNGERIAACEPRLPEGLFNRRADNWRALFQIAEIIGGNWPQRCGIAFAKLTSSEGGDTETLKVALLADIRELLNDSASDDLIESDGSITSANLVVGLTGNDEWQWNEANHHRPINPRWLSVRLATFGIKPQKLSRNGGSQARGYSVAAFADAFARYLPPLRETSGQVSHEALLRAKTTETDT